MDKLNITESFIKNNTRKHCGYESNLYEFEKDYLIKIFKTEDSEILKQKEDKIEILNSLELNGIIPLEKVYIDNNFRGYLSKTEKDFHPVDSLRQKNKEKQRILLLLRKELELLHQNNILFGDIHSENILYDGNTIKLCDLDNAYINNINFDALNNYISTYIHNIDTIDYRIDNYALNIFTVGYLNKISFPYIFEFILNKGRLNYSLNSIENKIIINNLVNIRKEYNDDLLINHLKKGLFK